MKGWQDFANKVWDLDQVSTIGSVATRASCRTDRQMAPRGAGRRIPRTAALRVALIAARRFALIAALCLGPLAARATGDGAAVSFAANDVEFLNLMGDLEAPRGYDTVSGYAPFAPPRPLTTMTLAEVLLYQERLRAAGTRSSAVGRYQFIHPTLRALLREHRIAETLTFDAEVQTYLARFLMHTCGFYDRATPLPGLANCLAGVWAALPAVTGPGAGRSVYDGDGLNAARTTPAQVLGVLARRFDW